MGKPLIQAICLHIEPGVKGGDFHEMMQFLDLEELRFEQRESSDVNHGT